MSATTITLQTKLPEKLIGFAAETIAPGANGGIWSHGLFTSDDGPAVYTFLDQLFGQLAPALAQMNVYPECIRTSLIHIANGTDATVWINPKLIAKMIPKTSIKEGQDMFVDNVADVRGAQLPGIELPTHGAIAFTHLHGWRRGLYFDFRAHLPGSDPNLPLNDVSDMLGSVIASLILRERIRLEPETLKRMISAGWFPFIRLPQDLLTSLYRDFEQQWDHLATETKIVQQMSTIVPSLPDIWAKKPAFTQQLPLVQEAATFFS